MKVSEENANLIKRVLSTVVLTALVLGLSFYGGYKAGQAAKASENKESRLEIQEKVYVRIADAVDYAGYKYRFTNTVVWDGRIVKYDGEINAAPELLKMQVEVTSENQIRVLLPEAKVMSFDLDESSIEIYDEASGTFKAAKLDDFAAFKTAQRTVCEKMAADKGVLDQAYKNAKTAISTFIKTLDSVKDYSIEYRQ